MDGANIRIEQIPQGLELVMGDYVGGGKVLDSGAHISTTLENVVRRMQSKVSDIPENMPLEHGAKQVRVADGKVLEVTQKTRPVQPTLQTGWGPVVLNPITVAVLPGFDGAVLL